MPQVIKVKYLKVIYFNHQFKIKTNRKTKKNKEKVLKREKGELASISNALKY